MSSETPADPPKIKSKGPATTDLPSAGKPDVEYDDFGLPMRKPRARTPVVDSSDSEDEKFEDAVAPEAALEDKVQNTRQTWEKPGPTTKEGYALPQLNGRVKERVETFEHQTEEEKPVVLKEDAPSVDQVEEVTEDRLEEEEGRQAPQDTPQPQDARAPETDDAPHPSEEKPAATAKSDDAQQPIEPQSEGIQHTEPAQQPFSIQHSASTAHRHQQSNANATVSQYSHQRIISQPMKAQEAVDDELEWQPMPAYARYDMYDDDNRLIAKENTEELEDMHGYENVGGAAKGYTRVTLDDDADSVTSLDDHTAYLFKEQTNALHDDDEAARDPLSQMQATKNLLTEGQRVAYVGLARLALVEIERKFLKLDRNRNTKKALDNMQETTKMWAQMIMLRLYGHMDINSSEQIMIEQLSEHGVVPADLTPALMANARVKNPVVEEATSPADLATRNSTSSQKPDEKRAQSADKTRSSSSLSLYESSTSPPPPPYEEYEQGHEYPDVKSPSELPESRSLDIDLRWTVMCDLFLVLISDGIYDSRSRELFEQVGKYLSVDWLEICRFEKRVTDALEMQEQADKENWNEDDHMKSRARRARNKRIAFMGLATVGGGLVIGLSAGLLAPVIGAGLAAGFGTIGVAGTSGFLAGTGGAAIITTTGAVTGSTIGVRAANRRTGNVKTFEYRPLHNNKRTNLIITLAGWMNGKVDDVRLPYSTVDPIMGDIYSVLWEPEMLRSMGDTINILATEALTQGLQQVLASTVLTALMAAMTLPLALTKLSYLIDNPWIVSQARADMAGLILADSIIDRNLGTRPITLVGFSLGSRVIFSCLKELASRNAVGLVQNVYMFGTPVVANRDEYIKARSVVPGRFVNGYATNDWILGYLFRATSGGIMRVAGLAPVQAPTIENIDVTELVPGHMAYRTAMPKLLREVGWEVESDEFTEIEDPDPENHEKRQRELINEIEEARKELEKKAAEKEQKGRKVSWWKRKKTDKKSWEVYDESSQKQATIDPNGDPAKIAENPIMFDIDAIRKEVAAIAAENKPYDAPEEDFEIKEIKSTLPPMKIDLPPSPKRPLDNLRVTKSYNNSLGITSPSSRGSSTNDLPNTNGTHTSNGHKQSFEEYDEFDAPHEQIEMTFDTSFTDLPAPKPAKSPVPDRTSSPWLQQQSHTPTRSPMPEASSGGWDESPPQPERPPLTTAKTAPHPGALGVNGTASAPDPLHNAWADEFDDDFGQEKEIKMSFM